MSVSNPSKVMMTLNVVMALVFLASVFVQFNDPDPWGWVMIYGLAALVCLSGIRGPVRWPAAAVVGLASLAWAISLAPDVVGKVGFGELFDSMKMKDIRVERGREMGGLLIITAWMIVLLLTRRRQG